MYPTYTDCNTSLLPDAIFTILLFAFWFVLYVSVSVLIGYSIGYLRILVSCLFVLRSFYVRIYCQILNPI